MKNKTSTRLTLATLGCLAVLTLPSFADPMDTPSDRDTNKPAGNVPPPAPVTYVDGVTPPTAPAYDPSKPQDNSNKPISSNGTVTRTSGVVVGPELARSDYKFVKKASACGAYEIAISQQASTQASNAQVRAYAATVVRDHERMSRELNTLAARRGAVVPVDHKHHDDLADLGKKTGTAYDEAYLDDIIDSHEDAISLLDKASKSEDTDVAAFAVQYLPAMRDHLARAKQLDKAID